MKKQNLKLIVAIFCLSVFASCGGGNKESDATSTTPELNVTESTQTSEAITMTAYEFLIKLKSDNFFIKDNTGKEFILTDALVWNYDVSASLIEIAGYDPKTSEYIGTNDLDTYFEGKSLKKHNINNDTYLQHTLVEAVLTDAKSVQNLKLYNPSEKAKFAMNDSLVRDENGIGDHTISTNRFLDKISLRGTFSELNDGRHFVKFINAEIIAK